MRTIGHLLAAVLLAATVVAPAGAAGLGGLAKSFRSSPGAQFISERQPTLAPFAHVVLCMKQPRECARTGGSAGPVDMTPARLRELTSVNRSLNQRIRPRHDISGPAGDVWTINPREGDCEDYALSKRHALVARGWPSSALRLAVVKTAQGEGHAVLVVRTSEGDLVLDNRTNQIRPWNKTGLRWVKIQSAANPRQWWTL